MIETIILIILSIFVLIGSGFIASNYKDYDYEKRDKKILKQINRGK